MLKATTEPARMFDNMIAILKTLCSGDICYNTEEEMRCKMQEQWQRAIVAEEKRVARRESAHYQQAGAERVRLMLMI